MKVALFTLFALLFIIAESAPSHLRGVSPSDLSFYSQDSFTCKDKSKTIDINQVNDDYCDCQDGSDEPGTNACPNGRFYCANRGFESATHFSSRVNDGVCDCCDGTDEYDQRISCPNTCRELGKKNMEAKLEQFKHLTTGIQKKNEYVAKATQTQNEKRQQIDTLNKKIQETESRVAELKIKKEAAEVDEKAAQATKDKYKPSPVPDPTPIPQADSEGESDDDEEEEVYPADTQPEEVSPEVQAELDAADNIISKVEEIRKEYDDLNSDISTFKNDIEDLNKLLNVDYGIDSVFFALYGQQFEFKDSKYSYTIKPFNEVTQDGHVNLGRWQKWVGESYTQMEFGGGAKCWNGPERSTLVDLKCGSEDKIVSVTEPNKCEYAMEFHTPLACKQEVLDELTKQLKEWEDGAEGGK